MNYLESLHFPQFDTWELIIGALCKTKFPGRNVKMFENSRKST